MKIKLNPFPLTLEVKLTDSLPSDVGGKVETFGSRVVMFLNRKDWEIFYIHESIHVVQAIEEYIECQLDDETEAYMLAYITSSVKKIIEKQKQKSDITSDVKQIGN